jgi:hypothetical protein
MLTSFLIYRCSKVTGLSNPHEFRSLAGKPATSGTPSRAIFSTMSEFFDRWGKKPKDRPGADQSHAPQRDSQSRYSGTFPGRQPSNPSAANTNPPAMPPRPTSNASPPQSRPSSEYGMRNPGSLSARTPSRSSLGIVCYSRQV